MSPWSVDGHPRRAAVRLLLIEQVDDVRDVYRWAAPDRRVLERIWSSGLGLVSGSLPVSSPTVTLLGDVTTGPHEIPVAAGKLTLVAIVFVALP